ncbi:ATP-dependent DNA ligase [Candidatus Woesearchaeota archaeon]|nr:ATP-dependent DNA ligase [Candidatus Woesearchaeota archaeon]
MLYKDLVTIYGKLESTTKRLEKTDIISEFLKQIKEQDLKHIIHLLEGRTFPEWDERKIGMSSQLVIKAISSATGSSLIEVENEWKRVGDLGLVAERLVSKKSQRTLVSHSLSTNKVVENIIKLSELEGPGTVSRKISLVAELLTSSSPAEAKYIVRTILEDLRIGVASGVLRDSISKAYNQEINNVERAHNMLVDYAEVALLAKNNKLHQIGITPGRPIKSMLAILVRNVEEAFDYLGKPAQFEYKLDGFRASIHKFNNKILIFTRRLEEVTSQFPDVVEAVKKHVKGSNFIIDAEIVGYDKKTGKYLPFQNISQRIKRKYDIEHMARKFPVELDIFDIIYYDNMSMSDKPLKERRALLEKKVKQKKGICILTKKLITSDVKEAKKFFKQAKKHGTEGVMIKNIESSYRPGRYVEGWCKMKSTLEPLDLVIVGAEYGTGKRAGFLTSYVLACRQGSNLFECGMVSTGVKEKSTKGTTYDEMTKKLKPLIIQEAGRKVKLKPKIVIEVGYEEIQKSPTYSSGYALRFPRFIRIRSDKSIKDSNTLSELENIYSAQN